MMMVEQGPRAARRFCRGALARGGAHPQRLGTGLALQATWLLFSAAPTVLQSLRRRSH
jgi:hypothetical protein